MGSTGRTNEIDQIDEMLSAVKAELPPSSVPRSRDMTDIARRAYEIYESRGRVDGADLEDWRQAQLESQSKRKPPAQR